MVGRSFRSHRPEISDAQSVRIGSVRRVEPAKKDHKLLKTAKTSLSDHLSSSSSSYKQPKGDKLPKTAPPKGFDSCSGDLCRGMVCHGSLFPSTINGSAGRVVIIRYRPKRLAAALCAAVGWSVCTKSDTRKRKKRACRSGTHTQYNKLRFAYIKMRWRAV